MKFAVGILLAVVTVVRGNVPHDPLTVTFRVQEATERSEVCMDELGCFERGHPFDSPRLQRFISSEPESREKIGTEFRFYRPTNDMIPQYITNLNFSSWSINDSGFNDAANTFFIIHDFLDGNAVWSEVLRTAILDKQKSNVFIVDWSNGAGPPYEQAVANIRVVGAEVGRFIQNLKNSTKLNPLNTVHIIGHGLGAHAAGYAGKWIQTQAKSLVSRITGLDPSGPFFKGVDPTVRLDKSDASFVDVIHTNKPSNLITGFGIEEAIGDVDYYPNGGEYQPGCEKELMVKNVNEDEFLSYTNVDVILQEYMHKGMVVKAAMPTVLQHVCSHRRAYELFIASFDEDCKFEARHCKDIDDYWMQECDSCRIEGCLRMGYYIDEDIYKWEKTDDMEYYLTTKSTWPYCFGK
uniref:U49-Eretoxin-Ek1d_1 n=1 Tax=Eresus cinnaberinus TaxID=175337 RepID=A0A2D0PCL7_ERECI